MSKFFPNNFKPTDVNVQWAIDKFRLSKAEVEDQLEQMMDHEFKRSYTNWSMVYRNWFRTADRHNLLKREYVYRTPDVQSQEEKEVSDEKAKANLDRLMGMVK